MRWTALPSIVSLALLASGCMYEPCDEYVDYICVCHEDDPEFDCGALSETFADADPALQDECALNLQDQQDEDQQDGLECEF